MIAEPPAVPAQGKEAEIAELYDKATANALVAAFTASVTKSIQDLFASLPADKQAPLLSQLGEQMRNKDATLYAQTVQKMGVMPDASPHPLAASFGAFKDDPTWAQYEALLREQKEEDRRLAHKLYPDNDDDEAV